MPLPPPTDSFAQLRGLVARKAGRATRRPQWTRWLRRFGRWLLVLALFALSMECLCFARAGTGFLLSFAAFLGWTLAVLLGAVAALGDIIGRANSSVPYEDRVPMWGKALVVLVPCMTLATGRFHVDARLWLWWHEEELLAAVPPITEPLTAPPFPRAKEDGFVIATCGSPPATLFIFSGILQRYGIAHDPAAVLRAGQWGEPGSSGMNFTLVQHLRGPWVV